MSSKNLAPNNNAPNETILDAAAGVNDLQFEDIDIPATDIYT